MRLFVDKIKYILGCTQAHIIIKLSSQSIFAGVYQILEGLVGIFLVSQFLKKIRELVGKMLSGLKLKGKQKENQVPSSKSDKIGLIEQFSQ